MKVLFSVGVAAMVVAPWFDADIVNAGKKFLLSGLTLVVSALLYRVVTLND